MSADNSTRQQEANWVMLGNDAFDAKDYLRALNMYTRGIVARPRDAIAWFDRARTNVALGRLDDARRDFDEAFHIDPHFHEALFGRALLERDAGNLETALAYCDRAIALATMNPDYRATRDAIAYQLRVNAEAPLVAVRSAAALAVERGENENALTIASRGLVAFPDDIELHRSRAIAAFRLKRYPEAAADYEAVAADHVSRSGILRDLAVSRYLATHDLARAERDFTEAIVTDPRDALALRYRGDVRVLRKNLHEAVADYSAAVAIAPNDREARAKRDELRRRIAAPAYSPITSR